MDREDSDSTGAALEENIERRIVKRTWGRMHQLRVEVNGNRVIVHGCTSRYYDKQLAIQAALEAMSCNPDSRIEVDIEVFQGGSPSGTTWSGVRFEH
jgi:hypothetical protein